ncbi:MAG: Clp protease N-terminal domain-containing protein, partial [Myxococcota bacterium]
MSITLRLEAYAKNAKTVISAAQALADKRNHAEVEPVHLLYELVDREAEVEDAIQRSGVDPTDVLVEAELVLRKMRTATDGSSYLSPRMLDLLGRAEGEAARQGGVPVGVEHLFLACAQETSGTIRDVFKAVGLSAPILRATLGGESASSAESSKNGDGSKRSVPGAPPRRRGNDDYGDPIEAFGRDLTRLASQGKFDPTVGRDAELRRMLQVLARRRENNPLLVGEPGIGKTTIVNALAQR